MVFVIGGAYQGKLDYVAENYPGRSVYQCSIDDPDIDLSASVINSIHFLSLAQLRKDIDPLVYLSDIMPMLREKIIICDDISCGVVPIESEARKWRENVGRSMTMLSKNADEVIRVFCGIGSRIK